MRTQNKLFIIYSRIDMTMNCYIILKNFCVNLKMKKIHYNFRRKIDFSSSGYTLNVSSSFSICNLWSKCWQNKVSSWRAFLPHFYSEIWWELAEVWVIFRNTANALSCDLGKVINSLCFRTGLFLPNFKDVIQLSKISCSYLSWL